MPHGCFYVVRLLSILTRLAFSVLHFNVLFSVRYFPVLHFQPPAILFVPNFHVVHFQSPPIDLAFWFRFHAVVSETLKDIICKVSTDVLVQNQKVT